jgi:hypothetical protein
MVTLATSLLMVNSYAATKCDDYRYLAFGPAPNITILETRVLALSGLRDVRPFPVSYALTRDDYQIVMRIYEQDYGPTATLLVNAATPMTLKAVNYLADREALSCIVEVEQDGRVKFSWLGKSGCAASQRIRVTVIDASGTQVAIEELPFTVVTNGRYCVKDAL